jgi:hypothetical protein
MLPNEDTICPCPECCEPIELELNNEEENEED